MGERTDYTPLKGETFSFDRNEAERWEPRGPIASGEIGTCLFRTSGNAWVLCQWRFGEGPWTADRRRLPCWEIKLPQATEWFEEHGIEVPPSLHADLEKAQSRPPGTPPRSDYFGRSIMAPTPEQVEPPEALAKPLWNYADLDGEYTAFDPESTENFYYRASWDGDESVPYREDICRVGTRWIACYFQGDGGTPQPITLPDQRYSAFVEVEIEEVVQWFNHHGRPLPAVVQSDLEGWKWIHKSARGGAYVRPLPHDLDGWGHEKKRFSREGTVTPPSLNSGKRASEPRADNPTVSKTLGTYPPEPIAEPTYRQGLDWMGKLWRWINPPRATVLREARSTTSPLHESLAACEVVPEANPESKSVDISGRTENDTAIPGALQRDLRSPPEGPETEPFCREKTVYLMSYDETGGSALAMEAPALPKEYGERTEDSDHSRFQVPAEVTDPEVPTLAQVQELSSAVISFVGEVSISRGSAATDEDYHLPHYLRLAHALEPLRFFPDRAEGWPHKTGRAIREIVRCFEAFTREWGWEAVNVPEPERLAYIAQRQAWYADEITRPMYEAALSWQAGFTGTQFRDDIDRIAEAGRAKGFGPTMTPKEGQERFAEARERLIDTPCLGRIHPGWVEEYREPFCVAANLLKAAVDEVVRRREDDAIPTDLIGEDQPTNTAESEINVSRPHAIGHPASPGGDIYESVLQELRKKGATKQTALFEIMKDRISISFQECADRVHGDSETSDEAIRKNVQRLNKSLMTSGIPIGFSVGSGHVLKTEYPA